MKSKLMKIIIVTILSTIFAASTAFSDDKGKGQDKEKPPGWEKGEKKGWHSDKPPGLEKKEGRVKHKAGKSEKKQKKNKSEIESENENDDL